MMRLRPTPLIAGAILSAIDQGLVSASNLLVTLILARHATAIEFGLFAISFATIVLVAAVQGALAVEPMLHHLPRHENPRACLSAISRKINIPILLIPTSLSLLISLILVTQGRVDAATIALTTGFAILGVGSLEFARRAAYAVGRIPLAVAGSVAYAIVLCGAMLGLVLVHQIGAAPVLCIIGASGTITGMFLMLMIGSGDRDQLPTRAHIERHWTYGRWALATSLLAWAPVNIHYYALPILSDLSQAAELRLVTTLILPAQLIIANLTYVLVPMLSRTPQTSVRMLPLIIFVCAMAAMNWAVIGIFGQSILKMLSETIRVDSIVTIWLLGSVPLLAGVQVILNAQLRARGEPRLIFFSYLAATPVLFAGLYLDHTLGSIGAAISIVGAYSCLSVASFYFVRRSRPATDACPEKQSNAA